MAALSSFNTSTGGLAIGDWINSPRPLAAPEYLPLNSFTTRYLNASYPTLASYYGNPGSTIAYSAAAITLPNLGWTHIEYGATAWIALQANTGLTQLYRSTNDGTTWTVISTVPAGAAIVSLKYGNGIWIALGGSAGYFRSTDDGLTWRKSTFPTAIGTPTRIAYGANVWVAVGGTLPARSLDGGVTWITGSALPSGLSATNMAYGDGVFIVSGYASSLGLVTGVSRSVDFGATWSPVTTIVGILLANGGYGTNMAFGNGVFVTVGYNFDGTGYYTFSALYTSSDYGVTWTGRSIAAASWAGVTFSNNLFLAVAGNIVPNQPNASGVTSSTAAVSSPDGVTWTARVLPSSQRWCQVAGNNAGKFIAISGDYSYTSTAGALIDFGATSTTFALPVITPVFGTQTFMKAT